MKCQWLPGTGIFEVLLVLAKSTLGFLAGLLTTKLAVEILSLVFLGMGIMDGLSLLSLFTFS